MHKEKTEGKGVKTEKKRRKAVKGKVENLNGRWKSYNMRRGPFCLFFSFLFFSFLFFFFLLLFACHFSKPRKFVLGLPKWKFSTGKKHFTPGKKSGKMTLTPSEKKFPITPLWSRMIVIYERFLYDVYRLVTLGIGPLNMTQNLFYFIFCTSSPWSWLYYIYLALER